MRPRVLRRVALVVAVALLAGCGGDEAPELACDLSPRISTGRTALSDCEVPVAGAEGERLRLVLIHHLDAEGRRIDVELIALRLDDGGRMRRLTDEEASAALSGLPQP